MNIYYRLGKKSGQTPGTWEGEQMASRNGWRVGCATHDTGGLERRGPGFLEEIGGLGCSGTLDRTRILPTRPVWLPHAACKGPGDLETVFRTQIHAVDVESRRIKREDRAGGSRIVCRVSVQQATVDVKVDVLAGAYDAGPIHQRVP